MLTRRSFASSALAALAGTYAGQSAAYISCVDDIPIEYGDLEESIRTTFWRSVGPQDRDVTVYALVAPWCPICTQLMTDALSGQLSFNLRSIAVDPRSPADQTKIVDFCLGDDAETLNAFHDRRPTSLSGATRRQVEIVNSLQGMTRQSVEVWREFVSGIGQGFGVPALIFLAEADHSPNGFFPQILLGYGPQNSGLIRQHARPLPEVGSPLQGDVVAAIEGFSNERTRRFQIVGGRGQAHIAPVRSSMVAQCYGASGNFRARIGEVEYRNERWLAQRNANGDLFFFNPNQIIEEA
jgi:hypothetical protein